MKPDRERSYAAFADRLREEGAISDAWIDGKPRFREEPLVVSGAQALILANVGERIAALYDEACMHASEDPVLLDSFFGLSPWQKAMWLASSPRWHGVARADVFFTKEGPVIAELNCDTPTGQSEAVTLGVLAKEKIPHALDPNAELGQHIKEMIRAVVKSSVNAGPKVAAIVYPTEFSEDLSVIRLYESWLRELGYEVVLGSPYNLSSTGTVAVFDTEVSLLVRHYKTDWWSERVSAWTDEELADSSPLAKPLANLLSAQADNQVAVVNPFGSVLPQNKRMMAFFWERIHQFSTAAQNTITELVPTTMRLESLHPSLVLAQREDWVLKSDYGAEGEEVIIGRLSSDALWKESVEKARPGHWVAQRYFAAETNEHGEVYNFGVYVVAGKAAGLYLRAQQGATDGHALSVPVLIGT